MRVIVLAAILATVAGAARAEEDANRADVRCVLAMSAMLRSPQYKDAGGAGIFYFAGRIEGRDPGFDLGSAMKREAGRMGAADYGDEARRCGAQLAEKNRAFQAMSAGHASRGVGN